MPNADPDRLRAIRTFPQLVKYLRDELEWPIEQESFDDLTFDYEPEELGLDPKTAVKVKEIKQLRPLSSGQPWGIFFLQFEPKRLPVVVLRRILQALVLKKRASAARANQTAWNLHDLLFISSYGESDHRDISFAHFAEEEDSPLPTLKVLGWDDEDTVLHLEHAHQTLQEKLRWPEGEADIKAWRERWSSAFTLRHREVITTSKEMAVRLAHLATAIRKRVNQILAVETDQGAMRQLMKGFQEALIHDLTQDDFADMYAQTVTYGLLTARISQPKAYASGGLTDLPITNPFLRDLLSQFMRVGGRKGKLDFDELGIGEVNAILYSPDTNMEAILRDFGDKNPQEDPVIRFYELFLKEYDPKKRTKRGVFYTPRPVVSYIVRSVHELLQTEFGLEDGLADTVTWGEMQERFKDLKLPSHAKASDPFVRILDPATGTGTFLVECLEVIHQTMTEKWRKQGYYDQKAQDLWNDYVPKHLLSRLYGFELMMAPYAIAHMKVGLKLFETGYRFGADERARIYLTNSLEPPGEVPQRMLFEETALAHEAQAVNVVKKNVPFTVVIGNPPYAQYSQNLSEVAKGYIQKFRYANDKKIRARNALQFERNINDDYVKFFGMASEVLSSGCGILGMITNRMFLDSESLVGLREHLVRTFDHCTVLDLCGSSEESRRIKRLANDENVFDILQGVAITFCTRKLKESKAPTPVLWRELIGSRQHKYDKLMENLTLVGEGWNTIVPEPPAWWLNREAENEDGGEWTLDMVFQKFSTLVASNRDHLVVGFDRREVIEKVTAAAVFRGPNEEWAERFKITLKSGWNVTAARSRLRELTHPEEHIHQIEYRAFDKRWIFFHPTLVWQTAPVCSGAVLGPRRNLVLGSLGKNRAETLNGQWVVSSLADKSLVSSRDNASGFPLYLNKAQRESKLNFGGKQEQKLNFKPEFLRRLAERLGLDVGASDTPPRGLDAEEILYYIYGVMYSPGYRATYSRRLEDGFPPIPLTSSRPLFSAVSSLGAKLASLHLMEFQLGPRDEENRRYPQLTTFAGPAKPEVEKVTYSKKTVWLDKAQSVGFKGVPEEVWEFHIGGYQVCHKWLKDRKGRRLSADDVLHYHKIVTALSNTIRLMKEVDKVIDQHGGWPGAFRGKA